MRSTALLLLALTLVACDSDDAEPDAVDAGSYAATVLGAAEASLSGIALFSANDFLLPTPYPFPFPFDPDTLDFEASYRLVLAPTPDPTDPAGSFAPSFRYVISEEDFEAGALVFTPSELGVPASASTFIESADFGAGFWSADSGRVAFEAVTDARVRGTFDVRFARLDRMTFALEYATAVGSFDAVVVEPPSE